MDARRDALSLVRENLKRTKLSDRAETVQADYLEYLASCRKTFDLIFLDPPYAEVFLENSLQKISEIDILSAGGIIICERPSEKAHPGQFPGLSAGKDYRYGKTLITLYRKDGGTEEL